MNTLIHYIIHVFSIIIIVILGFIIFGFEKDIDCSAQDATFTAQLYQLDGGFQTSAKFLRKIVKFEACLEPDNERKQKIYLMMKDLEIKASSYALLNKVFFWASLILAIFVILFPIINYATEAGAMMNKITNPAQLPAITLLAGLCFAFYADYKGKQTGAENLMRYTYYSSTEEIEVINQTIQKGLDNIDSGHDFSTLGKPNE